MPSCARKHQLSDSLVYHVFNRSNGCVPIFKCENDYQFVKYLLVKYSRKFQAQVYHWAIMQNHYHFLLELEDPERLSKMMAGFALAYTQYHHRKTKLAGYLWQGRFKAQPVQKESYMVACGRYIERNPVKAGIVEIAEAYPHSSARFYCLGIPDGITSEERGFVEFGRDRAEQQEGYRKFLRDFDAEREKEFDSMEKPVGSAEFLRRLVLVDGRVVSRRKGKPGRRMGTD